MCFDDLSPVMACREVLVSGVAPWGYAPALAMAGLCLSKKVLSTKMVLAIQTLVWRLARRKTYVGPCWNPWLRETYVAPVGLCCAYVRVSRPVIQKIDVFVVVSCFLARTANMLGPYWDCVHGCTAY